MQGGFPYPMSRGDWLPFTALAGGLITGIVLVIALLVIASSGDNNERSQHADYNFDQPKIEQPFPYNLLPPTRIPVLQNPPDIGERSTTYLGYQYDHDGVKATDWFIVALTAALVIVGFLQWNTLRRQANQLEKGFNAEIAAQNERSDETERALTIAEAHAQAALEQAGAAVDSANATKALAREAERASVLASFDANRQRRETRTALRIAARNANAARDAVAVAREMGQAQTRAYITIFDAEMYTYTTHGFPCEIYIWTRNIGRTPCRWIEIESNASLVGSHTEATDIPLNPKGKARRWPMNVSKDERFPLRPECLPVIGGDAPKLVDLMKEGLELKKVLVVQGAVRWETVFGEIFESTFFFWNRVLPTMRERNVKGVVVDVPEKLVHPPVECPTYRQIMEGGFAGT
jgi:hypothetical protein